MFFLLHTWTMSIGHGCSTKCMYICTIIANEKKKKQKQTKFVKTLYIYVYKYCSVLFSYLLVYYILNYVYKKNI